MKKVLVVLVLVVLGLPVYGQAQIVISSGSRRRAEAAAFMMQGGITPSIFQTVDSLVTTQHIPGCMPVGDWFANIDGWKKFYDQKGVNYIYARIKFSGEYEVGARKGWLGNPKIIFVGNWTIYLQTQKTVSSSSKKTAVTASTFTPGNITPELLDAIDKVTGQHIPGCEPIGHWMGQKEQKEWRRCYYKKGIYYIAAHVKLGGRYEIRILKKKSLGNPEIVFVGNWTKLK